MYFFTFLSQFITTEFDCQNKDWGIEIVKELHRTEKKMIISEPEGKRYNIEVILFRKLKKVISFTS
jgi:hypothetical protein